MDQVNYCHVPSKTSPSFVGSITGRYSEYANYRNWKTAEQIAVRSRGTSKYDLIICACERHRNVSIFFSMMKSSK